MPDGSLREQGRKDFSLQRGGGLERMFPAAPSFFIYEGPAKVLSPGAPFPLSPCPARFASIKNGPFPHVCRDRP